MVDEVIDQVLIEPELAIDPIEHMMASLEEGRDWPSALLDAMSLWVIPEESYEGRIYKYFIGGEAFDWLVLAERLCDEAGDLIPARDKEDLLFEGRLPDYIDGAHFKDLLGVQKYRGFLNFVYGVNVEEALQLAVEREVHKRHVANGILYQDDFSLEVFFKIYHESRDTLFSLFRLDYGYLDNGSMSLTESKEFTYWLFKYRLRYSDQAKIASDTRKGLGQLQQMTEGKSYTLTLV